MALSPLAVAVLGLLAERAMHPYEMFQTLLTRGEDRLVKVRPGTLYHTVDRLAEDGLIAQVGTERAGNRPERTTYEIADAGRAELREWVRVALAVPVEEFPRFPVAVAQAHNLPASEVAALLDRRLLSLRSEESLLDDALEGMRRKQLDERYMLDVDHLRTLLAAERDWLEKLVDRLRTGDLDWPDPESGVPAHTESKGSTS